MTDKTDQKPPAPTKAPKPPHSAMSLRQRALLSAGQFRDDEDGALIIFGIFVFGLMLAIGGLSFDLMRYEANRMRLQATIDRATLAAASLTQSLEPLDVVVDYFSKAGMTEYLDSIVVTEGLGSRRVEVDASINVPLHHGNFGVFASSPDSTMFDTLLVEGNSVAEESIGNVEISLVLDVSGSMGNYNRLTNLKTAAKSFIDTVYDASEPDKVSTSIVPYSMQVNAGATLLSHWTRDETHELSHCVNFATSDYSTTALTTSTVLEQTLHFDPWTTESGAYDLGEPLFDPACPLHSSREILAWQTNKTTLKTYIDSFYDDGNTSTDIGAKWGVALLDPSTQSVLTSMVGTGDVPAAIDGRPYDYSATNKMKILVLMTDGAHTNQYYMGDHRTGMSFVWRYVENGTVHYSVWYDGTGSTPITNPSGNYTYCADWSGGSCNDWNYDSNPEFWYHARSYDAIVNDYDWRQRPYGGDDAVQMTWQQVWAEIPPEYFSDEVLWTMGSLSNNERNTYEWAIDYHGQSTKDSRLSAICTAAKAQDIIVFTIGLEVTSSNATKLENCASSPAHAFDVDGLDITNAFDSIASQINQLRLVQ